jgi:hypothetical protein
MRGRALLGLLAAAALAGARPDAGMARGGDPAAPPAKAGGIQPRVDAAIEAGLRYLRAVQGGDGSFTEARSFPGGVTALACYTLRVCKVPADDPAAVRAFGAMRRAWDGSLRGRDPGGRRDVKTYTAALLCMALAEHGTPQDSADRSGERTYLLANLDAAWMRELVKHLVGLQDGRGRWGYGWGGAQDGTYDNSNTQYALLGLKAASRAGVRADTKVWAKTLQHLIDGQRESGPSVPRDDGEPARDAKGRTASRPIDHARPWPYDSKDLDPRFSMTAGGVGSVVICRSELLGDPSYRKETDAKAEKAARDGIAWMGRQMDDEFVFNARTAREWGFDSWASYSVYAVERAGVLAGVRRMGKHDWYAEGAEFLMSIQAPHGGWVPRGTRPLKTEVDPEEAVVSTCFALLFLARGTPPVVRGALTQALDDTDVNFAGVADLPARDFEDFIDLVLSHWRRNSDPAARERLFARTTAVGPRIAGPLVRRLSSAKDEERAAAFALLKHATGFDMGFDPASPPEARDAAAAKWSEWLAANESSLRYDETTGKILAK